MRSSESTSKGSKLLSFTAQRCNFADCPAEASHILVNKNNKLIEFYCFAHGLQAQGYFDEGLPPPKPKPVPRSYSLKELNRQVINTQAELRLAERELSEAKELCQRLGISVNLSENA